MRITRFRLFAGVLVLVLLTLAVSFSAAVALAEGALHPLFHRRASDTAALAQSVAHGAKGEASEVHLRGQDGVLLHAWWLVPEHPSDRIVIVCHGVADSAYGGLGLALLFLTHGYSVLVPDSRGHGQSGGFVTYGVLESDDMLQWLAWTKAHGGETTYGLGESLGGAILLESLQRGADFRAVIAECSYASFEQVADERVARVAGPVVAELLVKEALLYTRMRYGVNLSDARPDLAVKNAKVPVLLIHGLNDRETLPVHSREIAAQNSFEVHLWLVPGAAHTGAYAAAPREFEVKVLDWFAAAK